MLSGLQFSNSHHFETRKRTGEINFTNNETFCILFLKSLKSHLCFTLKAHFNSDSTRVNSGYSTDSPVLAGEE
jgi:hypothetical protein